MPLYCKYYLMKWIGDLAMKKKHFVRYYLYHFLKKTLMDDSPPHQKSRFCIARRGLFRHLTLKKSLKRFITEYLPDVIYTFLYINVTSLL